ncbi:phage tail tube protein [Caballeronia sp. AZ10_KS36]|uniref:phage tail tube protein n=1 Tax=Caballeronia sp. AZ10_KS36 TaxID=2921757 RepID=UPI0020290E52|nr:phage tail tube protein [Caballeronia sp. AZ10_KS36]
MANTQNRIAGTAYLTADGQSLSVAGDFEYNPSKVTRSTLAGQSGVDGYSEKPRAGQIKATLRDMAGLSLAALNAMTNVTIVVELANGKVIIGRNMWTVDDQSAKAEDGTVPVTWEGPSVTEN